MSGLISNPPYNMKWKPYEDKRFIPESAPKSNANYAFIQTALAEIDHQAVFLLPMGVLSSSNKKEKEIRKWLLKEGYIQCVIALPDKMFESTAIPVCLLLIRKNRETKDVMMVDARTLGNEEVRYQKGQFGGSAHTNREYIKKVTVLFDERIEQLVDDVVHYKDEQGISCRVTLDQIQEQDWVLTPSRYMETEEKLSHRRDYREIVTDINKDNAQRAVDDFGAEFVEPDDIFSVDADIFAPCALGGVLNDDTIPQLKVKAVCGSANNQLKDEDKHSKMLEDKGILYAPDYIVNSGGVINTADELNGYNEERAKESIESIDQILKHIFDISDEHNETPLEASQHLSLIHI